MRNTTTKQPRQRRSRAWTALALGASLLAAPAALAQGRGVQQQQAGPNYTEARIAIIDTDTKQEEHYVHPGDTLQVRPGERFRLRMIAVPGGQARKWRYPSARFSYHSGRGGITFRMLSEEIGSALVEVDRVVGDGRNVIQYQVLEPLNMHQSLKSGTFTIQVVRGQPVGQGSYTPPGGSYQPEPPGYPAGSQAERVVSALYQGILMRDADQRGAAPRVANINRGGYGAAVTEAQNIANSQESRVGVYSRGVTNEQRLLALFENLMGQRSNQVDPNLWASYLRLLNEGNVYQVVDSMVRSFDFRRHHGFQASGRSRF